MKALSGAIRDRAEAVIRAGSDVALHCNGDLAEMEAGGSRRALAGRPLPPALRAASPCLSRKPFDTRRPRRISAALVEQGSGPG